MRQIRRKVAIELYRSLVGLMDSYDCVPRGIVSFIVHFPSVLLYCLWQPRRTAPKVGDNVTGTRDPRPGKRQCILVTATAFRSVSNMLPLYSAYILTRSCVHPYYSSVFSPVRTDPVWGRAQHGLVQPQGQTGPDHKQAVFDWTGLVWTSPFLLMVVIQIRYGSYQVTAKTVIRPYF